MLIPKTTPKGNTVKKIGIWMSGGADSSILCYMLAEEIKKNNLDVKIVPLTFDNKPPFQFLAVKVKEQIIELLDAKSIFDDHQIYTGPTDSPWSQEKLTEEFHKVNKDNFKNKRFEILYSGITTNPPREVQKDFKWGILEDVELKRGSHIVKDTVRTFTTTVDNIECEFVEIKPFFNFNKKEIFKFYKERNLLDSLFPITRSCEQKGAVVGHCGECWWCDERRWAFGKL